MKDAEADRVILAVVARLKARRKELGLSLNRTAERAGMSHVGLLQIESGKRSPLLRTVLRLADALQISLADILSDTQGEA